MPTRPSNRIDAYRNLDTGEVGPAHRIGTTVGGNNLYQAAPGWEPVCRHTTTGGDEAYVRTSNLQHNRDGNWYTRS